MTIQPSARILAAALLAAVVGAGVETRSATAKEGGGACAALLRLIEETQTVMVVAGGLREKGSALAAYQTLRTTMEHMAARARAEGCGALPEMLTSALLRARVAPDAGRATLTLDLGLAALLSLAVTGTILADDLGAKHVPMSESALHADACPDLFRLAQRLDRGRGDADATIAGVLADLNARPRCAAVKRALSAARAGEAQLAIDTVVLDTAAGASASTLFDRCPEYPVIADRLRTAISIGAPLFNRDDHAGCRAVYEKAATGVPGQDLPRSGRCPVVQQILQAGLAEARGAASAEAAAWALRRAFDRVLGVTGAPSAPPGADGPAKQVEIPAEPPHSPNQAFFSPATRLRP